MNTETAVVVGLVLAIIVVVTLYSSGSILIDLGNESLSGHQDNVVEPEEDEHWWDGYGDSEEESSYSAETFENLEEVNI